MDEETQAAVLPTKSTFTGPSLHVAVCRQIDAAATRAAETIPHESLALRQRRIDTETRTIESLLLALIEGVGSIPSDDRPKIAARVECAVCRIGDFGPAVRQAAHELLRHLRP